MLIGKADAMLARFSVVAAAAALELACSVIISMAPDIPESR